MPPILSTPPVSNSETERKTQEAFYAFYRHWFSGAPRVLAGATVTFPLLPNENYIFNQSQSVPPDKGAQVHTIFTDLRAITAGQSGATKRVTNNALFTIYVRVRNPGEGMQSADYECRLWADALRQIFESGTQALAQIGIHHTKIRRGPVVVPVPGLQTRMLVVSAQLQYEVGY